MEEFINKKPEPNENFIEDDEKTEQDPWLNKNYEGKPLSVKSLHLYMNRGYNVNSAYHDELMGRRRGVNTPIHSHKNRPNKP